jgi:hypothetical protein
MRSPLMQDAEFEKHVASRVLDVLIRAGLIVAMVTLCN